MKIWCIRKKNTEEYWGRPKFYYSYGSAKGTITRKISSWKRIKGSTDFHHSQIEFWNNAEVVEFNLVETE